MVDDKLKPWLLEVNSSPAMSMDGAADRRVKPDLLTDTFKLIDFEPTDNYHDRMEIWNKKPRDIPIQAVRQSIDGTLPRAQSKFTPHPESRNN